MKHSLLALIAFAFASLAYADMAEELQKECMTNQEIVKQKGARGSCRLVLAPKPIFMKAACRAKSGDLVCLAVFVSELKSASMKLTCYVDPSNPVVDTNFPIKASGMDVAYIIKRTDETSLVVNSDKQFSTFNSENVTVSVIENLKTGAMTGQIVIMTEQGPAVFENGTCQKI